MLKIIRRISNWQEIQQYISEIRDAHAEAEKAYCAAGRDQFWLQWEPNYASKTYSAAVKDDRLWSFIKKIAPAADLAQIFYGNKAINWHRDASYAHTTASLLALGQSTFEIESRDGKITSLDLHGEELLEFDCKLRHRANNVHPDRIGIGMWAAKIPLPK
jgi:hypothetical protein